ncbi:MAG TPA: GH92 family glycosyl hydrolase [Kofleriaceae bacterium]|nr:GH92 family glycosyl hydrolase [Kofleriaceae bacterium]
MTSGRLIGCAALLIACGGGGDPGPEIGPVDMFASVDPFIGTGGLGFGVGSTYPGPALPFAMIHPGPDTRLPSGAPGFSHCAGYYYEDTLVQTFSLMRMNGTGVPDYGLIGFMPVDGMSADRTSGVGTMTPFSHDEEAASPGYYRVTLANGIQVELTSTLRAAIARITYPDGVDPVLVLDLEHTLAGGSSGGGAIEVGADGSITAMMRNLGAMSERFGGFEVHARVESTVVPAEVGLWNEAGLAAGAGQGTGVDLGGWLRFPTGTREVEIRFGVSFVDAAGAAGNLTSELGAQTFDDVRDAAEAVWRDALSVIELDGVRTRDASILATALYHALLMPTLMSDVDGRMRDIDEAIVTAPGPRYSDFSLWDTYRTLHPWLLLAEDPRNADFAASLRGFADSGGAYPRWSLAHADVHVMIGSPADMVMAESALKGVPIPDEETAYQYSRATAYGPATGPSGGRSAIEDYLQYGYVPHEAIGGSVSRTMEYAIADWSVAQWARRLGHEADAAELEARAGNWRNVFDADSGFVRPRLRSGAWAAWDGPLEEHDGFTEGTAWQYTWMVPHDLDGLADALGGRAAALAKLRELFAESAEEYAPLGLRLYYWHGNEPDIIAPWIFAAWGEPAESVRWIEWIFAEHYGPGPAGLPGNDDGGTLSAWALFGAAGIYPIAGTDRYLVAAPRQSLMVLKRPSGDLRIEAEPNPVTHPVPLAITLDGVPVTGPELTHQQLAGARVLRFTMGAAP